MIPSSPDPLEQAKADARLPATTRLLMWCVKEGRTDAPKTEAAAHELQVPRSTAAYAIHALVTLGYLRKAA